MVQATLLELFTRLTKYNSSLEVHMNGEDNQYPERVERVINASPTAKACAAVLRKFVAGKGTPSNDFEVSRGVTLRAFLNQVAQSFAYQNGAFIHVNYNLNGQITSAKVLPYPLCRIGKRDDHDYNGKIAFCKDWTKKKDIQWFDVFNPLPSVVQSQIKKAGHIKKYTGQVLFFNPDATIYPLSHVDAAYNDADSEGRISIYKNTSIRKGFFGKMMIIVKPLIDRELRDTEGLSKEQLAARAKQEGERDNLKHTINQFTGAENGGSSLLVEMQFDDEDIDKQIKFVPIPSNIDDQIFAHTETSVANNIRKAFFNLPSILIESQDNSIFGNSGALLKEAKNFYQEQTEEARTLLEDGVLNPIFSHFAGFSGEVKIQPLIQL